MSSEPVYSPIPKRRWRVDRFVRFNSSQKVIDTLLTAIEQNELDLTGIQNQFEEMHHQYYNYEWTWALDKLLKYWNKTIEQITYDDVVSLVELWKTSVVKLDQLIYEDAKKEFNLNAKTGLGSMGMKSKNIWILNRYVEVSKVILLCLKCLTILKLKLNWEMN